jgi:7,8-dihydroneopterin aldolase/epimerase/oxygenase
MASKDKIILSNARFSALVGILDHEKENEQDIFIDLEIRKETRKAGLSDNIEDADDYSRMHHELGNIIGSRHFNLIESIAQETAAMILDKFNADSVLVRVKKPEALKHLGVEYAAVEIVRYRDG